MAIKNRKKIEKRKGGISATQSKPTSTKKLFVILPSVRLGTK